MIKALLSALIWNLAASIWAIVASLAIAWTSGDRTSLESAIANVVWLPVPAFLAAYVLFLPMNLILATLAAISHPRKFNRGTVILVGTLIGLGIGVALLFSGKPLVLGAAAATLGLFTGLGLVSGWVITATVSRNARPRPE